MVLGIRQNIIGSLYFMITADEKSNDPRALFVVTTVFAALEGFRNHRGKGTTTTSTTA